MIPVKVHKLLNVLLLFVLLCLCYLLYVNNNSFKPYGKFEYEKLPSSMKTFEDKNVWLIFTKAGRKNYPLKYKFRTLLENMLNVSSVPLKFHIISDATSREIAETEISDLVLNMNKHIPYVIYDIEICALKMQDIVKAMTPYFSSSPGSYYSDYLFYISLALYRIAPSNQDKAILLDCDIYFKDDINLLFKEFEKFKSTALFGLAPELSTVYLHNLRSFKKTKNTTFGEYYHDKNILKNSVHPRGYQGYNSGVVLLNLKAIRKSEEFRQLIQPDNVAQMATKYKFKGHLGDQDFFTLLGYEYSHLIQTINCGFNRQLCTWWKNRGYTKVFDDYFKCNHHVVVLHGNCNTKIVR